MLHDSYTGDILVKWQIKYVAIHVKIYDNETVYINFGLQKVVMLSDNGESWSWNWEGGLSSEAGALNMTSKSCGFREAII